MKPFEESDRYVYDLTPESVVVDCGGYEGRFAAGIRERYNCEVHILEPVKAFWERIARRFGREPKIYVHPFGIGAETGVVPFRIKGDMTGRYADNPETEWVEIMAVEEVFRRLGLKEVALLKLNIEGSEFDVIERLIDSGLIKQVRNLQVQFHDVVPDAAFRFNVLQKLLPASHELTFDHGWVWQSWKRK